MGLAGCLSAPCGAQDGPKSETIGIPGTELKFDVVSLPGGAFKMGSPADEAGRDKDEGEVREVELKPFWIGRNEVTWGEFLLFYGSQKEAEVDGVTRPTPGKEFLGQVGLPNHFQEARRPIICLRWHSAMGYCHWISRKTGHLFRLPTEAEWEYACRGGSDRPAPEGLGDQAWSQENSGERTHEVGEKKGNPLGLQDMLGNVWEYCLEPYAPPGFGPVLRGGAWNSPATELRAANRQAVPEDWFAQDPNRPRSVWWLTGDYTQSFRMVRVGDAAGAKECDEYASKIEVSFQKSEELVVKVGTSADFFCRVWGEVKNGGDKALEELHLLVYYLNPKGKPHMTDIQGADKPGRATFSYAFPALANSAWPGEHRQPLKPGETRKFMVDIPQSFDEDGVHVQLEKFGGHAIGIVFAR